MRLISTLDLPVQGLVPLELDELEAGAADEGASRQLELEAGAADELPLLPRRLSSSCFQLAGREEREGVTGFLAEVERAGAAELEGESRQLEPEAGAADELPLLPRRLSSSCFQLAGREEREGVTAFLEAERAGAAELEGESRQLEPEAGAADELPLLLRRLSSSCFQLAGRDERLEPARLAEVERLRGGGRGAALSERGNEAQPDPDCSKPCIWVQDACVRHARSLAGRRIIDGPCSKTTASARPLLCPPGLYRGRRRLTPAAAGGDLHGRALQGQVG